MPTDPRHNRPLPSGAALAAVLRNVHRRLALDLRARVARGDLRTPDLSPWQGVLAEASAPLLQSWYDKGVRDAQARIALAVRLPRIRHSGRGRKSLAPAVSAVEYGRHHLSPRLGNVAAAATAVARRPRNPAPGLRPAAHAGRVVVSKSLGPVGVAFDLVNPFAPAAADDLALALAHSTLATLTDRLDRALTAIRAAIRNGLETGAALPKITAEVGKIVNDPYRAASIAMTEASRATHAGDVAAARESGLISGHAWLASSDACPLCEKLNGTFAKLGEAFVVDGTGPYARVEFPPRHPHCMCTMTPVLA